MVLGLVQSHMAKQQSITSLPRSPEDDRRARMLKYSITMGIRLVCILVCFLVPGYWIIIPAIGAVTAILGVYITRARVGENGLAAINRSFYISAVISAVLCTVAAFLFLPSSFAGLAGVSEDIARTSGNPALIAAVAVIIGIVLAV